MIELADVGHVAYMVTDLAVAEQFLVDFGFTVSARAADRIYFRAAGRRHHVYVAILAAEAKFAGVSFDVVDRAMLERAASIPGASAIEPIVEPGGGERVTLRTPAGHTLWLEHGVVRLDGESIREVYPLNFHQQAQRLNRSVRQRAQRVPVLRFGHFVLQVPDARSELEWFLRHFNLVPSDYLGSDEGDEPFIAGAFLRFARGAELVEHHCLLINQSHLFGCHHSSFEVLDLDAAMAGHEYLKTRGYTLDAGVGRHLLGSLVYDYWRDPFGHRIEHYTDTDMVNDDFVPSYFSGTADETTQWGMAPDHSFFD